MSGERSFCVAVALPLGESKSSPSLGEMMMTTMMTKKKHREEDEIKRATVNNVNDNENKLFRHGISSSHCGEVRHEV